ncbi:MAG: esterase-like activity of phytase family protein [Nitrospira sp.]|nr:esterase-like activity of phytase family protein [Nitrospira sp.]
MVLERNNRGIGVGAELTPPNKKLFRIDMTAATDFSPPAAAFSAANCPAGKVTKVATPFLEITHTLPELGNKLPEKLEGLAIGPRLKDGSYLLVIGTDNDYSVTQNSSGQQFDVYFRMTDADPYQTSIFCPLGRTSGCFFHDANGDSTGPATLTTDYALLPGMLLAYKVSEADLGTFVRPGPPFPGGINNEP